MHTYIYIYVDNTHSHNTIEYHVLYYNALYQFEVLCV